MRKKITESVDVNEPRTVEYTYDNLNLIKQEHGYKGSDEYTVDYTYDLAGNDTVSLDWNDNNEVDLDGYNVYRSETQGDGYAQLNVSLLSSSDYIDNSVTNGITYYYVVRAVDDANNQSGYSNEDSATPDYQDCTDVQEGGHGLASDINSDCYVNSLDIEKIAYYWLYTNCAGLGDCEDADLEPDGDVDLIDFSDFAVDWMRCNDPQDSNCTPNW